MKNKGDKAMQKMFRAYFSWAITAILTAVVIFPHHLSSSFPHKPLLAVWFVASILYGIAIGGLYEGRPIDDKNLPEDSLFWVQQTLENNMLVVVRYGGSCNDPYLIKITDNDVVMKIVAVRKEKGTAYIARQRFTKKGEVRWAIAESSDERIAQTSKGHGRVMRML